MYSFASYRYAWYEYVISIPEMRIRGDNVMFGKHNFYQQVNLLHEVSQAMEALDPCLLFRDSVSITCK